MFRYRFSSNEIIQFSRKLFDEVKFNKSRRIQFYAKTKE